MGVFFGAYAFGGAIYGFDAFWLTIIAYSVTLWPVEVIGFILIVVSIIKLKNLKRLSSK